MTDQDPWAYDDLQLRIDRDAVGTYRTLAMAPDGRTARGSFQLPISDEELDEFVLRVGLVRRRRGPAEERLSAIKEFGANLFDALFADQVGNVYNSAKAVAADGQRGLRITLRLSGAPELMRLPWEFLYHRPRFIAQSTETPVVRTLDVASARRPQKVKLPLRILGIVSSPVGYQGLDADSERRNLEIALKPLSNDGRVELSWLERATLSELSRRISEPDEIHVIHYIGHGAYSEATEAGILVLETPEGRAHDVSGEQLGAMLQDERTLRLVVLNSCEGARTSHIDPFSGVATSLIEFDIPAVIGMQFEITDTAAIAFSDSLYTGLARGMPIDAAVAPARRAIMAKEYAEFGTPVLFLRAGDARLFDIDADSPRATRPAPPEPVHGHTATSPEQTAAPPAEATPGTRTPPAPVQDDAGPSGPEPPTATAVQSSRAIVLGRALWGFAFAAAVAGFVAVVLVAVIEIETEPPVSLGFIWLIGFGLAGLLGAIAARVTGVRRRTIGILLALAPYLGLIALVAPGAGTPLVVAVSLIQVLLIWAARRLTRPPNDGAPGGERPASGADR